MSVPPELDHYTALAPQTCSKMRFELSARAIWGVGESAQAGLNCQTVYGTQLIRIISQCRSELP